MSYVVTSAREWNVRLHLRWVLSVVLLWFAVCRVVCPRLLFCSAWMCCLEEIYIYIYICLQFLFMCTMTIWSSVVCVYCMSVVVNVMLTLMSVMSPPPALCDLWVCTVVKLCTFGVFSLGASLVSWIVMISTYVSWISSLSSSSLFFD